MFPGESLVLPGPRKMASDVKVSWAYPNSYAVGMAGLGFQLVWWLLEMDPQTQVKRVFTDTAQDGWTECDLLGFTLSWELDYQNVLSIIRRCGTSELSRERDETAPIVFGGGPVLTANPEPFAEFFDVVLLGDAEVMIPKLLEAFRACRHLKNRRARLEYLSSVEGIYVPSLFVYETEGEAGPLKSISPRIATQPPPRKQVFIAPQDYVAHSVIVTPESTWGNTFLVELVRSCPQECRFCLASFLTRPFRAAGIEAVLEAVDRGRQHTRHIGLVGPSVTEHPNFQQLAEEFLCRQDLRVTVPSVRMDTVDACLVGLLTGMGQKSLTIAIESGSEKLRLIMKKNLTEQQILDGMDHIAAGGLQAVKFYGIVGLPGELDEDVEETVRLLTQIKKTHRRVRLTLGVSSFVPKAQTPFQWAPRDSRCKSKIEYLQRKLCGQGIDVRPESHNWSDIQTYLSRADRRAAPLLLEACGAGGKLGTWRRLWRRPPPGCPSPDFYVFRELGRDEVLPWAHLVDEPKAAMLRRHNDQATQLSLSR